MNNSKPPFFYSAYGLTIQSELPLPELLPAVQSLSTADITISFSQPSASFNREKLSANYWRASPDNFYMHIDEIDGDFHITNGNRILAETEVDPADPNVRVQLFGTCIGVLIQQRDILPLHASCISKGNECIIISGQSGSGKSTLAMALNKKGYSLLCDDICGIHFSDGKIPYVYPGIPQTRIAADSAGALSINTSNIKSTHEKFILPADNRSQNNKHSIKAIFSIEEGDHDQLEIDELHGARNLGLLVKNTYTIPEIITCLGKTKIHFNQCSILANLFKVRQIFRTNSHHNLPDLISVITDEFENR